MITVFCSVLLFAFLIAIGHLLMFYTAFAYWLIPVYLLILLVLHLVYRKPNCHALELRDFILALLTTCCFAVVLQFQQGSIPLNTLSYLYLISYISILSFANSIRFKSLM